MKSKLMLIMVFAIFICTVSATCAADANETTIATQEDNQMELTLTEDEIQTNENDNMLTQTEDAEILTSGEGSYSDLRTDINSGGNLTKSHYRYNAGDGDTIEINTPGVINGNGAVIDMNGSTIRAFTVTASGVTIKNLTIINANYDRDGGAIIFYRTGTVTNCNFINNKATGTDSRGGAVYFSSTGTVTNCNFINNKATGTDSRGGAVYFVTTGTVTNCNFVNNSASTHGGAVYFRDGGDVANCNFVNNSASTHGGAVYFYEEGTVSNCNFINNTASSHGGAIWISSGRVENCNFTDNRATGDGGAIRFSSSRSTVSNCNFTHNSANHGSAVYFDNSGRIENCNLFNNSATRTGGAIYFRGSNAFVTNCNLVDNRAIGSDGGGAIWMNSGKIVNCNFTNNNAFGDGGAVVLFAGDVENCNFINNQAINGNGGAIWMSTGSVTNSNFVNHNASYNGGAIWMDSGKIDNCNFTGNNATAGSAIFIYSTSDSKNVSNSCFLNNRANAENLDVTINENNIITITFTGNDNLLNAIYSNGDVDFSNVTYWGANRIANTDDSPVVRSKNEAGQNITVVGVVNGNIMNITKVTDSDGKIVLEDIVGDYCIIVRHNTDSYYTEAEKISTNMKLYANVTPQTTNNRTVNITAKSNIPNEVINGKLLFILPNGTQIEATYGANGTWWAEHTFDACGEYKINATYVGLDNVTINNGTITINKVNSTITLDEIVLDYGETKNVTVTTTGATGITAKIGESDVKVDGFVISIPALDAGTYTLTVTAIADNNHNNVTKNATIIVNKLKTELTGSAITTTYNINKDLVITLKDSTGKALSGVKVTVDLNGAKTYTTDKNGQVKVSTKAIAPKAYTAKVTFNGDTNYDKSTKDIKVIVKKATPKLTAKKKTFKTTPKTKKYTIVLKDNAGKAIKKVKVTLKVKGKTYKATTNSKGKATFKITNLNKKGTFKATITYKGNKYYNKVSKKANIKVIVTFKTVSKGSKDKATVKEIQQALKDKGYYLTYQGHYLKVDGKFSSCTFRSVKEFQHDKGLKITGKVDEKTAHKLGII